MVNSILLRLEQLGFSSYEAKAYLALLRKHPANGYEVSKISRIPVAKIYDTLNRLKVKGAVAESGTDQGKYYPVPPEALMNKLKQDLTGMMEDLEVSLKEVEPLPDIELTMNLSGYEILVDKLHQLIVNARQSLLVSLWPAEAQLLADDIVAAEKRGVTVVCGVFGAMNLAVAHTVNLENCGRSSEDRLGNRLTVAVADATEVVIGEIGGEGGEGIWTTTPAIVLVAKEYVKHDIWGHFLIEALGEEKFAGLCRENSLLSYLIKQR
ncbi:MAG: helix-turn-helix domain-containing protein [Negativicutes bacterium]|nr:helix-turn-helix domain-containing protein [Negativicutes bacterium]